MPAALGALHEVCILFKIPAAIFFPKESYRVQGLFNKDSLASNQKESEQGLGKRRNPKAGTWLEFTQCTKLSVQAHPVESKELNAMV